MPVSSTFHNKLTIRAYLRRPNADGYYHVRLIARFHGDEFSISPGILILPKQKVGRKLVQLWEPKTRRVTDAHPNAAAINAELLKCETDITEAFHALAGPLGKQQVTSDAMWKKMLAKDAAPVVVVEPVQLTVLEHYAQWAAENEGILSTSYLKQAKYLSGQLHDWKPKLPVGELLTEKMVRAWQQHLVREEAADGSIANSFKWLRTLAGRIGVNPKLPWLKYKEVNAAQLDLTRDELHALLRADLGADERLQQERDRWMMQLLTGRRYSDLTVLRPEQLTELTIEDGSRVPALRHHQQKVTTEVLLPLPPLAIRIGERWNWQLPAMGNRQRNVLLKQVAKAAGITRLFNDAKISGGKVTDNYRPAWEIIGTHTARHTAGSLLLEVSGGDESLAAYVLGHVQGTTTGIYAKDKARRIAPLLLQAWQKVLGEFYDTDLV
ncbi:site-specific integrase [Hymenobacter metallilatus]|uniref:Tyr recombinase domain-containing protein n=1 Tax=Hymenobacter metallilatus TaxID=2493666 RepID=A0A428JCI5_9BACT|nr:tyrosine-type recombinase/integrase [Hymenobacter metallilatus]RSK29833.1 hypothetical protein EI290_15980 [Hymenobacter metallilatus]